MKELQNCLYLTRDNLYAHKEREAIVIKQDKDTLLKIPIHTISSIYCFGQTRVSPGLMAHCAENDVNLAYFDLFGQFQARVQGRKSGNVLLRRAQYRTSDNAPVPIARNIIAAKIQNSRSLLMRHLRNHGKKPMLTDAVDAMKFSLERSSPQCECRYQSQGQPHPYGKRKPLHQQYHHPAGHFRHDLRSVRS